MGRIMNYPIKKHHNANNDDARTPGHPLKGVRTDDLTSTLVGLREQIDLCAAELDHALSEKLKTSVELALLQALGVEKNISRHLSKIEHMEHLALTDELTGALNRRGFERELESVLSASGRYNETGVLVYIDLDGFKPINDTFGHAAGDLVLQKVVELLKANIRPHDTIARLGGDEFGVILSRTSWANGLVRAEMLERIVNNAIVHCHRSPVAIRASFGFQRFGSKTNAIELMEMADQAMYEAKRMRTELARIAAEDLAAEEFDAPNVSFDSNNAT